AALWSHRSPPAPPREYATAPGQRAALTLPDGSRVLLSVGTRLLVPRDYGGVVRSVELEGEAYFVVRHDPARPFLVRTAHGTTEDLGTEFDVRAYREERSLQVVVAAGRVALRGKAAADSVLMLRPRERGVIESSGSATITTRVSLQHYLAWTRGTLRFDDAPLSSVLGQLERWYDLDIQLPEDARQWCIVEPQRPARPGEVVLQRNAGGDRRAAAGLDHAALTRPPHQHGIGRRLAPQRHPTSGHDDLQGPLLSVGTNVELGSKILGRTMCGANEEGARRIVPYDEVRFAFELHGAHDSAVVTRHQESRADAEQHARAIRQRERRPLPGRGRVLAWRCGRRTVRPEGGAGDQERDRRGDPRGPHRRRSPATWQGPIRRLCVQLKRGSPRWRGTAARPEQPAAGGPDVPRPG